ncbi:glycosyltransferase [Candidatus Woesearchaeota archaeon]|nr:glycosyltransferase [Candidatus Woesearchaeota archaeon]
MIPKLADYTKIVGKEVIDKIRKSAEPLQGKHIVHINATSSGGGVAEILNTLVYLMNDVGIDAGWRTIVGSQSFFKITKAIHNSLQGKKWKFTEKRQKIYLEYCERNSMINHIRDHDMVFIHDPQPLGMIRHFEKKTNWIWRCHIDISNPHKNTLKVLLPFIKEYQGIIVSTKKFRIKNVRVPQFIIAPSIDPLSRKNERISHAKAKKLMSKKGIDLDKPILTQISRFDPWKGTGGVVRMYAKIKEKMDCQLVLMGDMAADDPQGPVMFYKVKEISKLIPGITTITERNDLLVNALQQESAVVFQNSLKEGFALTVSEAMWKKTPVLGTDVGGIPLQLIDGKTGYIIKSRKDGVEKALRLLKDDELRKRVGAQAHEHVKKNFLITRHLQDYINLMKNYFPKPK